VIILEGLLDMVDVRIACQNVFGKHGREKSLERPKYGW
jgi:hypothetical protein